jgi:hypothetical protein
MLSKSELKIGSYYEGECRNSGVARWNGNVFLFWRSKFADVYIDNVPHFEDEEPGMDFFAPIREAEYTGLEVPLDGRVGDMAPEVNR